MRMRAKAVVLAMALFVGSSAMAQILPDPNAVQWREVGAVGAFEYSIDERSLARDGDTLTVLMRGWAPPSGSDKINTIVARLTLDCQQRLVALGVRDYYREVAGFARSSRLESGLVEPTDPGQILLLDRLCVEQP